MSWLPNHWSSFIALFTVIGELWLYKIGDCHFVDCHGWSSWEHNGCQTDRSHRLLNVQMSWSFFRDRIHDVWELILGRLLFWHRLLWGHHDSWYSLLKIVHNWSSCNLKSWPRYWNLSILIDRLTLNSWIQAQWWRNKQRLLHFYNVSIFIFKK